MVAAWDSWEHSWCGCHSVQRGPFLLCPHPSVPPWCPVILAALLSFVWQGTGSLLSCVLASGVPGPKFTVSQSMTFFMLEPVSREDFLRHRSQAVFRQVREKGKSR